MLVKPTVPELLRESKRNRYSLVIATAKRARQISNGSQPMVSDEEDTSPVTLAADEIGEGKVQILDEKQWEIIEAEMKKNEAIKKESQEQTQENNEDVKNENLNSENINNENIEKEEN